MRSKEYNTRRDAARMLWQIGGRSANPPPQYPCVCGNMMDVMNRLLKPDNDVGVVFGRKRNIREDLCRLTRGECRHCKLATPWVFGTKLAQDICVDHMLAVGLTRRNGWGMKKFVEARDFLEVGDGV